MHPVVIALAVRWYARYRLSYADVAARFGLGAYRDQEKIRAHAVEHGKTMSEVARMALEAFGVLDPA